MTEAEWRTCDDPSLLLQVLDECRPSERKFRLFACDCCRRLDHLMSDPDRAVVAALEGYAEGLVPRAKVYETAGVRDGESLFASWLTNPARRVISQAAQSPAWVAAARARAYTVDAVRAAEGTAGRAAEWTRQSAAVRCIFGNPFRATVLRPEWRTDAVLALARAAYTSGDCSLVPILADALQEAGCEDSEALNHCRTGNTHARGCWVVDLILGKQ